MKFGKKMLENADPTHLHHCIAYDVLKKAINVVIAANQPEGSDAAGIKEDMEALDNEFGGSMTALSSPGCQPPDSRFHTLLQHELDKVNRFAALQLRTLLDTLCEAQHALACIVQAEAEGAPSRCELVACEQLLDAGAGQLVALERFRRLNFTGFRKIAKKFDKRSKEVGAKRGALASWFVPHLLREHFVAAPLDPHLQALAWGYAALRRMRRGRIDTEPAPSEETPPVTTVYWLTPAARMRALCTLVKRFEIALAPEGIDFSGHDVASLVEQQHRVLRSMSPDGFAKGPFQLSMEVSMTFHDAPGFPMYMGRISEQNEQGFHCRRSVEEGCRSTCANDSLVERDGAASALGVHAITALEQALAPDGFPLASPVGEDSASEALKAAADAALESVACAGPICHLRKDDRECLANFARQVRTAAEQAPLSPVATVGCARVLLRGDSTATCGAHVAIDEDVQFSRSAAGPAATAPSDAIDFPYCLLEVACYESNSAWMEELHSLAAVRKVAGFSIGAHAVAALHGKEVPELPHWYQHLTAVESAAPPEAWGLTLEWRAAVMESADRAEDGSLFEAEAAPPQVATPAAEPQQGMVGGQEIAPKNYLASERTMLEWMHTVLALAFVGVGLWRYSVHKATELTLGGLLNTSSVASLVLGCYGLTLVAIGVAFAWYSVLCHFQRLSALQEGQHTERVFNTRRGPVLFAAIIGISLMAHSLLLQVLPFWQSLGSTGSMRVAAS